MDSGIDWLTAEAEFISLWNSTDGTINIRTNALPQKLVKAFRDRYTEETWLDRAYQAMEKFPLQNGNKMRLEKFLDETKVDEILDGMYDWDRHSGKNTNASDLERNNREVIEKVLGGVKSHE